METTEEIVDKTMLNKQQIIEQKVINKPIDTKEYCPVCNEELFYFNDRHFPCRCEREAQKEREANLRLEYEKEREERIKVEREKQREIERVQWKERIYNYSNLPLRLQNYTIDNFKPSSDTEKVIKTIKGYVDDFKDIYDQGIGIFLLGPTGSGKTHLAAAIANAIIQKYTLRNYTNQRGPWVKYWNTTSLYRRIQSLFNNQSSESDDIIEECENAHLLILDDVGAEKPSEWTRATFYDLLNFRIDELQPTILTSNLKLSEIEEILGSRVASRLSDRRCFTKIVISAPDFRKTATLL